MNKIQYKLSLVIAMFFVLSIYNASKSEEIKQEFKIYIPQVLIPEKSCLVNNNELKEQQEDSKSNEENKDENE